MVYKKAFNSTNQFAAILDNQMSIKTVNRAFLDLIHMKLDDIKNTLYWELPIWEHSIDIQNLIMFSIESIYLGEEVKFETTYIDPVMGERYIEFSIKALYSKKDKSEIEYIMAMGYDVTDIKLAERNLKIRERELEIFFEAGLNGYLIRSLDEGVFIDYEHIDDMFDKIYAKERLTNYNKAIIDILEIEPEGFDKGKVYDNENIKFDMTEFRDIFKEYLIQGNYTFEKSFMSKKGYMKYVSMTIVTIIQEGLYKGCFYVVTDITNTKNYEQQLFQLANFDSLTGVYNRRYFIYKLNGMLIREEFEEATMIMMDIDNFKLVNDNYGHDVGDIAIKEISSILNEKISPFGLFARIGGEEFAAFIPKSVEQTLPLVEECMDKIRRSSIDVKNNQIILKITISMGISKVCKGEDFDTFFKRADNNLYKAKQSGRNRYVL